ANLTPASTSTLGPPSLGWRAYALPPLPEAMTWTSSTTSVRRFFSVEELRVGLLRRLGWHGLRFRLDPLSGGLHVDRFCRLLAAEREHLAVTVRSGGRGGLRRGGGHGVVVVLEHARQYLGVDL